MALFLDLTAFETLVSDVYYVSVHEGRDNTVVNVFIHLMGEIPFQHLPQSDIYSVFFQEHFPKDQLHSPSVFQVKRSVSYPSWNKKLDMRRDEKEKAPCISLNTVRLQSSVIGLAQA